MKEGFRNDKDISRRGGLTNRPSPSLEERVRILEHMMGIYSTPESVDEFLRSENGRAEYRAALVQMSVHRNRKPFEEFVKKTGGRVPR